MRLFIALLLLAAVTGVRAQSSDAPTKPTDTDWYGRRMAHKWERGVVNTLTGVAEIPAQTIKGYDRGFDPFDKGVGVKTAGTAVGLFRGVGHAVGRTTSGVYELLTFWAANPASNEMVGTPFDAEFSWSTEPPKLSKEEAAMAWYEPAGNKAGRGGKDFLLGGSEFVYQWTHGPETNSVGDVGQKVGLGLYMFVSRELNGIFDLVTFLLPNPRDQVGIAYDVADPWNHLKREVDKKKKLDELLK